MPTGAIPSSNMALPISEKPHRHTRSSGAHPAFYIASWIFCSNLTILFNKWLIDSAGFRKLHYVAPIRPLKATDLNS